MSNPNKDLTFLSLDIFLKGGRQKITNRLIQGSSFWIRITNPQQRSGKRTATATNSVGGKANSDPLFFHFNVSQSYKLKAFLIT